MTNLILTDRGGHAALSPSSAFRWMTCTASVGFTKDMPNINSAASLEGTKAHDLGELMLLDQPIDYTDYPEEMISYINDYADYVNSLVPGAKVGVEVKVNLTPWIPNGYGTADAIVYDEAAETLHVVDLKYGMTKVHPRSNPQLMCYGLGAWGMIDDKREVKKVAMHIYQPRTSGKPEAVHTIDVHDLLQFGGALRKASDEVLGPDPQFRPSEGACKWCLGAAQCPALYEKAVTVVGADFDVLPNPGTLSPDVIASITEHRKLLDKFLKAVDERAVALAETGDLPGYKLVEGSARRVWNDKAQNVLLNHFGDTFMRTTPDTIGAVEKALGKEDFAALELTELNYNKPSLVPEDDKRSALPLK